MSTNITPGSTVAITVAKTPTNGAAQKTLSRLFAKDPANRKARQFRKELLRSAMQRRRRGGRFWIVRPKAPRLFQPIKGATCTLLATSDVIGDLRSVSRFIDVRGTS